MKSIAIYIFSAVFVLIITATPSAFANEKYLLSENKSIIVGVRDDARPFSYRTLTKDQEPILQGYGGYMIEICRRVLQTMTTDATGPFSGYKVVAKSVEASKRFTALKSDQIHLLCGPNSITLDRLESYNASLPLFLSGISFVTVVDEMFPRKRNDCVAVLGFLANTTAQNEGLQKIAEQDYLQLYDSVLDDYLGLTPSSTVVKSPSKSISDFVEFTSSFISTQKSTAGASGKNAHGSQENISVPTCVGGYGTSVGPIISYERHQQGIDDLCAGKLLFYVADSDIMKYLLENTAACKNNYKLHHETLTREAYAVFFSRARDLESGVDNISGLLFSEFSNELQQKMQRIEGVLRYEFEREFKEVEPTNELQQFFSAFQFVKDH